MTNKNNTDSKESKPVEKKKTQIMLDNNFNIGKLFWGLLFVLVGGLALASNFGLVDVNFANIWRLWPLMIIAAGLSILSLRNMFGRIIAIVLALATLGAVAWVVLGDYPNFALQTYKATIQKSAENVKQVEVKVKAGASTLKIGTLSDGSVAELKLESNIASLFKFSKVVGDTQQVILSMETTKNNRWMMSDTRNLWDIDLTPNLPLILDIDAGASNVDIDMSEARLRDMNIKTGASSITLKLGDKEDVVNLNIESGVSSIIIKLPVVSGVQLKLNNGLTSNNLADLIKVGDNTYESSGYNQSKKQINITSKIGLSSFTIERY